MSRYLPNEVFEFEPAPKVPARPRAWGLDLRAWLFLAMGLAGILTVALVVTADSVYADIDAMRGVSASAVRPEDPPITKIPLLGGLLAKIHDIAPSFFGPSPDSVLQPPASSSPPPSPSNSPSSLPVTQPIPSASATARPTPSSSNAQPSVPSPTPTGTPTLPPTPAPTGPLPPAPTGSPTPAPTASPAPAQTASPTPSPVPTPAPVLAISIDRGATAAFDLTRLVPGDSMTRAITVQNGGSVAFRYTVSATQTASTALWTDTVDGLQLTVRDAGGTVRYAGPLSGLGSLTGPTILAPGTAELLSYTVDFPVSASNAFQGLVQDLTFVFDAIEFP
ncbi:MAG TPA: hypothetical protein VL333_12690 [Candidatus Saccharimonadales bacterium]|nr:hypothetical protein [Candidatus Saccharimonadales bacterium]